MLLTIKYNPEMNVYTINNGTRERVISPLELKRGSLLEALIPIFKQAKAHTEKGGWGITVNV